MAELFQKAKSTINEHIKNIYEERELTEKVTTGKFGNSEFSTKPTNFYNLVLRKARQGQDGVYDVIYYRIIVLA